MAIVKVHNKTRNITYVYESISYWDKELKQPHSRRKLIGRLDPATGDVVPTGKRGRSDTVAVTPTHSDTDYKARLMKKACDILMDTAFGKERING